MQFHLFSSLAVSVIYFNMKLQQTTLKYKILNNRIVWIYIFQWNWTAPLQGKVSLKPKIL